MLKIYVAGAYTAPEDIKMLSNMRRGINLCVDVARLGLLPFCPWLDYTYGIVSDMPLEVFKAISLEELRRSDACLLVSGWENSAGTKEELKEANLRGIPVFESISELWEWAKEQHMEIPIEYAEILKKWNDGHFDQCLEEVKACF